MPTYDVDVEGVTYEVDAPNPDTAWQWANYTHRQKKATQAAAPKPEGGFFPALKAGAIELGGGISALAGKLGLKEEAAAQAEYEAAKKRAGEVFKPTEEGWTEAPFTKFKELLGGSVPYMAAPLAAGAAAATLPISGPAAAATALGAAGLTSAAQFTATNLSRQLEEGKKLAETDLGAAALAAVPQAALDTLSMRMIPGIGRMFGQAGIKITAENAKEIAEQGLKKTLIDYTAKTGKTAGIEGATEAAQQVFERLQAGLSITDPEARKEYFDSFLGGAVLGGTLAPAGRFVERGKEQKKAGELLTAQAAEEKKAARAAEEAEKAKPEYIQQVAQEYEALSKQKADLQAQIKTSTKEAPLSQEDRDRNAVIQQQIKALDPELKKKRSEYLAAGGPDALKKAQEQYLMLTPPPAEAPAVEEEVEAPEVRFARAEREVGTLSQLIEQQRAELAQAATPEDALEIAQRVQRTQDALTESEKTLAEKPKLPNIEKLQKQLAKAQEEGKQDLVIKYAQQLIEARKQAPIVDEGLFDPARMVAEEERQRQLGEAMGAGREAAGIERTQAEIEQQVAREQAARSAALQEQLEFEGRAEREAMLGVAADRAADMRARELEPLRTAQQTTLFPEGTRVDTRPKPTATETATDLLERVASAPNVDDATKNFAAQLQDNFRALNEDDVALASGWAYRTLTGTGAPEAEADLRSKLASLERGRISETEPVTQYAGRALTAQEKQDVAGTSLEGRQGVMTREPTGELRRAVQTEIDMPEPTSKAFESFGAFNDYLASEGLQAYRLQKGMVFPTLANLQKRLAPIQARVGELQKQLDDVNAKRNALLKADVAERASAEALLRESQQKLQATVKTLDDTARTAYVGPQFKQVDLVDLFDQAHGRLNASLKHSANLRNQFAQALGKLETAEAATKPVMVDANGNATEDSAKAVRTVAQGQLPGYQALRNAQLDLQAKGNALVEADQKLSEVVRAGIGQSWDAGSPTLTAYLKAKQAKDAAQKAAQQAHFAMMQAHKRIPSAETLNNNLTKFITEKGNIDAEMAKAAKSLSAIRLGVRNASNRLNDAYVRAENMPELRFGENLLRLRNDLLAAQNIRAETMERSVERQAQAGALAKEARGIAQPMRTMERQVGAALGEARERAEARRGVPPKETQADREARDAEERRQEQERLERLEKIPSTRIEFERAETDNQETRKLIEAVAAAPTKEERVAARKALDDHLKALVARKDAELQDMQRKAAKNVKDLDTQRKAVAELTERLKGDLTPKRRESAEKQLAEAKRKLAEHERRYTLNTREMKITRTDVQAQRQERNRLLAEASGRRVEGERLGPRAIGPVTREEAIPPKALLTASPESRAGKTATDTRQRLTEARGAPQRDVAITKKEMAEAEAQAAAMKTLAGVEKAEKALAEQFKKAKERGFRPGEQTRFQERQAILSKRKEALRELKAVVPVTPVEPVVEVEEAPKKRKPRKAAEKPGERVTPADEMQEELDSFEIEVLPGENQEVFFSRGPTADPSTADSLRTELKQTFPDLGRVQIYDSVDALIAANPQYEGKIPSDARGFVDTAGNKAFLIAENVNKGDGLSVLLHEVGAHIGLKNMLGDAQYNTLVNAVKSWEKKADGSKESQVAQAARARVEAAETTAGQVNDELLAYAIEEAVKAGVKPTETKGVLGQWLSRVAALFRKALEKFGLPPKALDAQGLVDMAFGAAKMEMSREAAPAEKTKTAAFERWFGDSKVVDENGKPLVVYHGSSADITEFRSPADRGEGAMAQAGLYFTQDRDFANIYGMKGAVYPVYLSIKNPLDLTVEYPANSVRGRLLKLIAPRVARALTQENELRNRTNQALITADERAELQALGYDGIKAPGGVWIAFAPTQIKSATGNRGTYDPTSPDILFSRNLPTASRVANQIVGEQKGWFQGLKDNFLGMGGRAQFVDKLAPIEEALKRGGVDQTKALQAMYYLRMYDQRMHFTSQAITDGVPEIVEKARKDGETERLIETKPGANISQIVDILKRKDVVKAAGSPDAANKLFTLYLAAIRAKRVGLDALNFGKGLTQADLDAAMAEIEANDTLKDAFNEARDIYIQYNRNLVDFAVQTGALSKDEANRLLRNNDYIPYYRMRGGVAELIIGNETPIRIGNLKDSPHLKELVGGDEPIMDFLTSSVQNTSMMLDMAMKNLATKNAMFELRDVGLAKIAKTPNKGAPEGSVTFKRDGEDYFAVVDTDTIGISGDLLVKGMAGIPTMFPAFVRLFGMPARFLRRAVVASPVYMARQLFRDTLAATLTSGADIVPVLGALNQIGKPDALKNRGITGGQVFTGMPEDMTRMLKEMQAGKVSVTSGLAWLEAKSAQLDALTRRNQYDSYIKQGLSEMEATYMALESMNFSKRGLSPSLHMASTLIPFFNAQIQGLDVLYKAFTGKMPMNEKLDIRQKLWTRGLLLAGASVAYALAMQDDEAYKNAKPEEKYSNWFVRLPGVDEPLRLPIPFELGYVFKALPEALVNSMLNDKGAEEAAKAGAHIARQMVPGLSSYFLPAAIKPELETILNKSIYTQRDIESAQERMVEAGYRYRDNTTQVARELGELTGFSPIQMENLVRGHTGTMGMALLQALSFAMPSKGPEKAFKRLSEQPLIGTLFQPNDARGIIDATYERMKEVQEVQNTYKDLLKKGRPDDARKYAEDKSGELALASVAGNFRQVMGELSTYERQVRAAPAISAERKREILDRIRQQQIRIAASARQIFDRSKPQAVPA